MSRTLCVIIPSFKAGGSERVAADLLNYAVRKGIIAHLILMNREPLFYSLDERVIVHQPEFNKKCKVRYYLRIIIYIRSLLGKIVPDAVLVLGYRIIPAIANYGYRIRLVGSYRTSPYRVWSPFMGRGTVHRLLNIVYRMVNSWALRRYDAMIMQSEEARDILSHSFASNCKFEVIPNFLRSIKQHNLIPHNRIVCVGRLSTEKGQRYLLKAFARLMPTDWELHLVGDGPQRTNLERLAEQLQVAAQIQFLGFQENVDFHYQSAKIFVLPSLIEGFPNALLEAMANGLACVSFDCKTGPSNLIEDGRNGYLVRVKDVDELAAKLQYLITEAEAREEMGRKATEVQQIYSIEKVGQNYLDFIF